MKNLPLETCRKLKEAGYPQETAFVWYGNEDWPLHVSAFDDNRIETEWEMAQCPDLFVACPTADELLEALGDKLVFMETGHYQGKLGYAAYGPGTRPGDKWVEVTAPLGTAETPALALANLWLALNGSKE